MIKKKILDNGLTILYKETNTESITIEVCVKAGCVYEPEKIMGVSHFLEHMMFNGTKKRSQLEIASVIENLGGEMNAATSNDRTFYYIKIIRKYFDIALDVLSDMILNSNFPQDLFDREKKIVLDEIKMVYDTPRHYQFVLFHDSLYKDHPASKRVLGTEETIKNLSRADLIRYYRKMYVPNNMIVSVVGNAQELFEKIEERFSKASKKSISFPKIPICINSSRSLIEKRKIAQSYYVMGYSIPLRKESESLVFDIIRTVLGKGQSGWIFDEVRSKRGLAYDVGVHVDPSVGYGFFVVYANTNKKNIDKVKRIIFEQFERLQNLTQEELDNAKKYIEGDFILENEDTQNMCDEIAFWALCNDAKDFETYINRINKISLDDIKKTAKKYLTQDYSEAIIIQKD